MIKPPPPRLTATELPRGAFELLQFLAVRPLSGLCPSGDGHPVIVIPGFGGAAGSTRLLRDWLCQRRYDCRDWGLGRNYPRNGAKSMEGVLAFRNDMVDRLGEQITRLQSETGRKVSLVGWSLGGIYAHELACQQPEQVRQVITLGTPFGDPRGTCVWPIMARLNGNRSGNTGPELDKWLERSAHSEPKVPTTVIHSRRDGFVNPTIAKLPGSFVKHIEVDSSHIGFPANPRVFWHIAKSLANPAKGAEAITGRA